MKIDIIIPTYNREQAIVSAVDSVLKQSYQDFSLIVVDDGSSDKTRDVLRPFIDQGFITYYYQKNAGVSSARNFAIKKSSADYICFLDSDDQWLPEKLSRQVQFFTDYPEIEICHTEEIWIRNGVRVNQMKKHQKFGGRIFSPSLKLCLMSPSSIMIKKNVFSNIGLFREDFPVCEDYDLWLRIACKYDVGFLESPLIKKYGGHSDQLSSSRPAMDYFRIVSMWSLISGESRNDLKKEEKIELCKVLLKKAKILLKGYEKHHNFKNYDEIKKIQTEVQNLVL